MPECDHAEWVSFNPNRCYIHRKGMEHETAIEINTIVIKVCLACGKILEVRDYGE